MTVGLCGVSGKEGGRGKTNVTRAYTHFHASCPSLTVYLRDEFRERGRERERTKGRIPNSQPIRPSWNIHV